MDFVAASFPAMNILQALDLIRCISMLLEATICDNKNKD